MEVSVRSAISITSRRTVLRRSASPARPQRRHTPVPLSMERYTPASTRGQQFVIVAEFQQLRVGVFEQLDGRPGRRRIVENERGRPADYEQIVGIVGNAGVENLAELRFGKQAVFAAHNSARSRGHAGPASSAALSAGDSGITVMIDVIFVEPVLVGIHERAARAFSRRGFSRSMRALLD